MVGSTLRVRGVSWVAAWTAAVLVVVGSQAPVDAAVVFDETRLIAPDGVAGDSYGQSVAAADGRVVVGAPYEGTNSGSAYVYEADGSGGWNEPTDLTADDNAEFDQYGWSVAVSGDRIVVGAPSKDDGSGAVYLYEADGSDGWEQTTKLTADDASPGDYFGSSVAVSGDRIVVGAFQDDDDGTNSGSAYVYEFDGDTWDETKLTASDASGNDAYGYAVAVTGDQVVVGAPQDGDDENGASSGSAYVYAPDGDTWDETKLTASDAAANDLYGSSVATVGDRIVVGATDDNDNGTNSGSAYVYDPDGDTWDETKLLASDGGGAHDHFGYSVAVAGDRIVVGAPDGDNDNGINSGSVYVYQEQDTTPPVVTVPDDITVDATSLHGAAVDYEASASDDVDPQPTLECAPPSGATFPLGTTEVACTATDEAGNSADASFDIAVVPPDGSAGITILVDGIEQLGLPNGVERSLAGPLNQADRLLDDPNPDNDQAVCNKLASFGAAVADRLADGSLTSAQADLLTTYANALSDRLGCLPG